MKLRIFSVLIGLMIFGFTVSNVFAEEKYTFEIDGHNIITNSPDIHTIDIDWDSEYLPKLSVNFTKPYTGQFQIQIPKNMPRTMNLDFETTLMMDVSSLSGTEQEKDWNEHITEKDFKMIDDRISETESLCYYVITVELSNADYFKIVTGSVASGRWEPVTIQNEDCNDKYNETAQNGSVFSRHGYQPSDAAPTPKQFQTGIIQWDSRCYSTNDVATVTVTDRNMDDSNIPDQFQITIWSDWMEEEIGESKVVPVNVIETGNSTGIFESLVFLGSAYDESSGHRIPVGIENVIFAKYVDPVAFDSNELEIIETTSAKILSFGDTWERWTELSSLYGIPLVYDPCLKKQMDLVGTGDGFANLDVFYPAPLKQIESGLHIDEIICKDDLVLIKKNNGYRYCVNPDTAPLLHERGWSTSANLEGESSRQCYSVPDVGLCKAAITKYYFDSETNSCKPFVWGGCGGTVPFDTVELCQGLCK